MNFKQLYNLTIAFEAIFTNRLRSLLTALGIIFGVAAVISMLAIGNGAKQEVLNHLKLVGVNNIVIKEKNEEDEENAQKNNDDEGMEKNIKKYQKPSPGLTLEDAKAIESVLPNVLYVSPEIIQKTNAIFGLNQKNITLVGVSNSFFNIYSIKLESGNYFSDYHYFKGLPVCIIGKNIAVKIFKTTNPIGKQLKVGNQLLEVIGVLQSRHISNESSEEYNVSNTDVNIYTPINTYLLRYKDNNKITEKMIAKNDYFDSSPTESTTQNNQINKLVVHLKDNSDMETTSKLLFRMLKRRHNEVEDFEIHKPELLLKQKQKDNAVFNIVLGVIAGISLLVGGIGIMNIMLASVMERIKEIGIRLAIGATKKDIISQFLFEATLISITGGIIGIILGYIIAVIIQELAKIETIISGWSIVVSFSISVAVGILFGYTPAKKAAKQDPVNSLRYE